MKKKHVAGKDRNINPSTPPTRTLKLKRQTVRNLSVKTGIRTGGRSNFTNCVYCS